MVSLKHVLKTENIEYDERKVEFELKWIGL